MTTTTERATAALRHRLEHLPVTVFSSVMGVAGLSLAWRAAHEVWSVPAWPAQAVLWLAGAMYAALLVLYVGKWVLHPAAAREELSHPVLMTFVPTVTVSALLLATAGQDLAPPVARVLWWTGAVGHLVLTVVVLSAWATRTDIGPGHVTPAWFIPVVGNMVTPLAAAELGSVELGWFAFGLGLVLWGGLLPLLLHRVLLHEVALPERLLPTLAIFTAPPAVAALAWTALGGSPDDPFARVLLAAALAFLVLLLAQVARLHRVPFSLPYWAYSFPLAAVTVAATAAAGTLPQRGYDVLAWSLLVLTTLVVALVLALTTRAVVRGQVLVPESSSASVPPFPSTSHSSSRR